MNVLSEINNLNNPSIIDLIIENIQNKQVLEEKSHIVIPDLEKIKQIIRVEEQLKLKQKELHMLNHKIKSRRFLSSHYNNSPNTSSPNTSNSPSPNNPNSPTIVININNTPSQKEEKEAAATSNNNN